MGWRPKETGIGGERLYVRLVGSAPAAGPPPQPNCQATLGFPEAFGKAGPGFQKEFFLTVFLAGRLAILPFPRGLMGIG